METTITLDAAGRIVVPMAFRKRLKLGAGSRLRVGMVADRLELTPEPDTAARVTHRGRRVVLSGVGRTFQVPGATKAENDERLDILAKRLKFK